MYTNPYQLEVPLRGNSPVSQMRRALEPFCAEHMEGFGAALEGRVAKDEAKRARAHTLLRIAAAGARQARHVALEHYGRFYGALGGNAHEAALGSTVLVANIAQFTRQMIHVNLEVYPRLIAPRICSIQPFTEPSGFVFYLKYTAKDNGVGGGNQNAGRSLADLSKFDPNYSKLVNEGDQIKAVGMTLAKTLVEVEYRGLMHQHSHQVDIALRSQYGLSPMDLLDMASADELAWEVDRTVVNDVITFAGTNPRGTVYWDPTKGGGYNALTPSEQLAYDKSFARVAMTGVEVDMATDIFRRPNWYICGANVSKQLAKTPETYAADKNSAMYDQSIYKGGIIFSGQMTTGADVWFDPQMDANTMVCGYVDNMNPFYAGFAMCPFGLASVLTAAFQDPDTLLTKRSRALAFARFGINNKQFRTIKLGVAPSS